MGWAPGPAMGEGRDQRDASLRPGGVGVTLLFTLGEKKSGKLGEKFENLGNNLEKMESSECPQPLLLQRVRQPPTQRPSVSVPNATTIDSFHKG